MLKLPKLYQLPRFTIPTRVIFREGSSEKLLTIFCNGCHLLQLSSLKPFLGYILQIRIEKHWCGMNETRKKVTKHHRTTRVIGLSLLCLEANSSKNWQVYDIWSRKRRLEKQNKPSQRPSTPRKKRLSRSCWIQLLNCIVLRARYAFLLSRRQTSLIYVEWLIFCQTEEVNAVWSAIAQATASNDLGIAAKVSPGDPENLDDRKPRVICVYTRDFTDTKDVSRVVHKLKDLGIIEPRGKAIHYKCGKRMKPYEYCKQLIIDRRVHLSRPQVGKWVQHQSFVIQLGWVPEIETRSVKTCKGRWLLQ